MQINKSFPGGQTVTFQLIIFTMIFIYFFILYTIYGKLLSQVYLKTISIINKIHAANANGKYSSV